MKENVMFWIRIGFYVLILSALVWVGLKAGGDPCERCKLEYKPLSDTPITCRELINYTLRPVIDNQPKPVNISYINVSELFVR